MTHQKPATRAIVSDNDTHIKDPRKLVLALTALIACLISQGVCLQQLFSYCGFLVMHFGLATRDTAGYYAGNIVAGFMLGRTLISYPFGILADRWGRKSVIYISLIISVITSVLFGFCSSYPEALVLRFLMGFNGIVAVSKTMVSELCPPSAEAAGMAVITGSWYAALIVAPALGGVLYNRPFFGWEVSYPHLLPNVVSAAMSAVAMVFVFFLLPETLKTKELQYKQMDGEDDDNKQNALELAVVDAKDSPTTAVDNNTTTKAESSEAEEVEGSFWIVILVYSLLSFVMISVDETFNLWTISSVEKGGLGWDTDRLGVCLSVVGIPLVVFTVIVYPAVTKYLGTHSAFSCFCWICIPVMGVMPFVTSLSSNYDSTWFLVVCTLLLFASKACGSVMFASTFIMINHSVPKSMRGRANGIGMCTGSLAKALGPIVTSPLYAWSIDRANIPWLVFIVCSVVLGLTNAVHLLAPGKKSHV